MKTSMLRHIACVALPMLTSLSLSAATFSKLDSNGPSNRVDFLGVNCNNVVAGALNCRPSVVAPLLTAENIYAPCMIQNGTNWNLYYGGWLNSGNGNDYIYLAVSLDGEPISGWYHTPPSSAYLVIDRGSYTHVNDPSVVRVSSTEWVMMYTAARTGDLYGRTERINYATSTDGATWNANGGSPANNTANSARQVSITWSGKLIKSSGRPVIAKKSGTWYMWFNGYATDNTSDTADFESSGSSSGWYHGFYLATSTQSTPTSFTVVKYWGDGDADKMPENDVKVRADGTFLGCWRPDGLQSIVVADSSDGITWTNKRTALSTASFTPAYVTTTAIVHSPSDDRFWGLLWGGSTSNTFAQAKIYIGYNLLSVNVRSGSTWHVLGESGMNSEFRLNTGGVNSFDQIQIINPITGSIIIDQSFTSAHLGDRWVLYQ